MDPRRLGTDQKKAWRIGATIVFLDESGLLMGPLVRRTWALRGQTPILTQKGRAREKASAIAAVTISPKRHRFGLQSSLLMNANVDTTTLVPFLRRLADRIRGPILLIWDRLAVHRAREVWRFIVRRSQYYVESLPPYAPELNPVEMLWAYLKHHLLANFAPATIDELVARASLALRGLRRRSDLLRSFLNATPLCLQRTTR